MRIAFTELTENDIPLIHRWLNEPHVAKWYHTDDLSLKGIETKYLPRIQAMSPTKCFLFLMDENKSGLIQWYFLKDYPEYGRLITDDLNAVSIDLFIGEKSLTHRGLGSLVIRKFLKEVVFADPVVSCCYIGPATTNEVAKRAYSKVGFVFVKEIKVPGEDEAEYVMLLKRDSLV